MTSSNLIQIQNLEISFGPLRVVRDVSFSISKGEVLGIVGESGSGKTLTAYSLLNLIPQNGRISRGNVLFNGEDITTLSPKELRKIRGKKIAMIFQEPMTSLNPVMTVESQIREILRIHKIYDNKRDEDRRILELMKIVEIPAPEKRLKNYPHELSGGMRQRILIAMALACGPELLVADEPTTALDVTIQAQILKILKKLKDEFNMGIIFITHDLALVKNFCDRIAVMYLGEIVEMAEANSLFENPRHPYTEALIRSVRGLEHKGEVLPTIKGMVPSLKDIEDGCSFKERCDYRQSMCDQKPENKNSCLCFFPLGDQ